MFYPPVCAHCGSLGSLLCPNCYESIEWSLIPPKIKLIPIITSVQVACTYSGPIKSMIRKLKFKGVADIAGVGASLMYQSLCLPSVEALVPVPLHPKRHQQRGYNQAQLLATALAQMTHLPVRNILERTTFRLSQVEKESREQRVKLLSNQFRIRPHLSSANLPKSVLIIDDVMTTGATISACAKVLKLAGIKTIHVAILAHGY